MREEGYIVCEIQIDETHKFSRVSQERAKRSMFKESRFYDLTINFTRHSSVTCIQLSRTGRDVREQQLPTCVKI